MSSSEAKNLEAISRAIDQHNRSCDYPAVAVAMNPYEIERLGWDTIRGLPIRPDPGLATGRFNVVCGGDESDQGLEEAEAVEAVSEQTVPVGAPTGS
ncbi:MAG TPA: hypothetical protein VGV10_06875 [Thermoleophilaceae bacterium]|nr:hypothetical protein [Thermoleophilaceae bacterium]